MLGDCCSTIPINITGGSSTWSHNTYKNNYDDYVRSVTSLCNSHKHTKCDQYELCTYDVDTASCDIDNSYFESSREYRIFHPYEMNGDMKYQLKSCNHINSNTAILKCAMLKGVNYNYEILMI